MLATPFDHLGSSWLSLIRQFEARFVWERKWGDLTMR